MFQTHPPVRLTPIRQQTMAVGKWHQGQQPAYLPDARGFDAFLGLPFSVDDGAGFVSPCPANAAMDVGADAVILGGKGGRVAVNADRRGGVELGLQLPLPLITQRPASSEITEQPTDLRLLTSRYSAFAQAFAAEHAATDTPMFMYVQTATSSTRGSCCTMC